MKKSIFMSLLGMFVCLTMSAETIDEVINETPVATEAEVNTNNEVHFPVLNPAIEGSALMTPYQSALPANEGYRQSQEWRDALHLRNAGAIVCSIGMVGVVTGGVVMFTGVFDTTTGGNPLTGLKTWEVGAIVSGVSLIPLTAGAIMWGIGNKKKKKIQMQYTGNGLTMNF